MTTQTIDTQMPDLPQAARLHMARYLAGMDVQELARATGISRNTIAKYEALDVDCKRNPAYLRVWALATGVSYEWLTGAVPPTGDGLNVIQPRNGRSGESAQIIPFLPAAA